METPNPAASRITTRSPEEKGGITIILYASYLVPFAMQDPYSHQEECQATLPQVATRFASDFPSRFRQP